MSHVRAPESHSTWLLASGLALALSACHRSSAAIGAGDPGTIRPGDSLFERLEEVRVLARPQTIAPAEAHGALRQLLTQEAQRVEPAEWSPVEDQSGRESLWRMRPYARVGGGLVLSRLTHDQRRAVLRANTGIVRESYWNDKESRTAFRWNHAYPNLLASRRDRPEPVELTFALAAVADPTAVEPGLANADLTRAASLASRATLGQIDRPVLGVGAPSELSLEIQRLDADELRLAVGLLDLGFRMEDKQLIADVSRSDGVRFTVEVESDGIRKRMWTRLVQEAGQWEEASVDLSSYRGRWFTLHLLADPGPAGDSTDDYALWSGLRFHGHTEGPPSAPHVVLLDVDTLRADRLGCYGYERKTTPRIDDWVKKEASLFLNSTAAGNWTVPSTISLLTGLAVFQHQVAPGIRPMEEQLQPLALRLKEAGYQTYARTDGGFMSADFGFQIGFDVFDCRRKPNMVEPTPSWDLDLERIRERRSARPMFYLLQTYEVHSPFVDDCHFEDPEELYAGLYRKPVRERDDLVAALKQSGTRPDERDWRYINDIYDAGIRRMDARIGAFLEGLDEAFGDDPYMVVFTSDHGEELGERGGLGHGYSLTSELLQVPLMIRYPYGDRVGRFDTPVSSLDVLPTILECVGLDIPSDLPGASLLGSLPAQRIRLAGKGARSFSVELEGWKLLTGPQDDFWGRTDSPSLFHLELDPGERRCLITENAQRKRQLQKALEAFRERYHPFDEPSSEDGEVSDAVLEGLAELGYTGD